MNVFDESIRRAWYNINSFNVVSTRDGKTVMATQDTLYLLVTGRMPTQRIAFPELDEDDPEVRRKVAALAGPYGSVLAKQRLIALGYKYNEEKNQWEKQVLIIVPTPGWMFRVV